MTKGNRHVRYEAMKKKGEEFCATYPDYEEVKMKTDDVNCMIAICVPMGVSIENESLELFRSLMSLCGEFEYRAFNVMIFKA